MAWDSSRPVPWKRLAREWVIYVVVMGAIFLLLFRDRPLVGVFAGLLVSGPLYLAFGYVLAKFGYQRKTWRQLRTEDGERSAQTEVERAEAPRPKPAPTSRTGGHPSGRGRPGGARKRRR